jgi:hypothetical protein
MGMIESCAAILEFQPLAEQPTSVQPAFVTPLPIQKEEEQYQQAKVGTDTAPVLLERKHETKKQMRPIRIHRAPKRFDVEFAYFPTVEQHNKKKKKQ